jgi:hypothetical protein
VAVRHSRAVQRLSSATRQAESRPGRIGPISLDMKQMGERSAGNPHAAFDAEGAGNVARSKLFGLNRRASPRPYLCGGRPVMGVPTAIVTRPSFQCRLWLVPRQPKSRSEREPTHEASGPSPAEPMVRILFPPAGSPLRLLSSRQRVTHRPTPNIAVLTSVGLADNQVQKLVPKG